MKNIAIIGSSGALGRAFTEQLSVLYPDATLHAFSRAQPAMSHRNILYHIIDYEDEASIQASALAASKHLALDLVIVATGILHDDELMPEKSLRELSAQNLQRLFAANTILPALIAKHYLPKLNKDARSIFAALSARVGSISDNQLGGWYSYRASKAALNMIIKNAAIEVGRRNQHAIIVGLHPGTVDTRLSQPFQNNIPSAKLFTPELSVKNLLSVLDQLTPAHSGKCYAWDGQEVQP
jgi:NAD(P)-dependent dehydrogenase (short-subunit alcohol dehydrogenase family)